MKNKLLLVLATLIVFVILNLYNIFKARQSITNQPPINFTLSQLSYPNNAAVSQPTQFSWYVDAPKNYFTDQTSVFYGYQSSPSALTKDDSPQAVGYQYQTNDYASGHFRLPDLFTLNLYFPQPGLAYFRFYAKVAGNHLWSKEYSLIVR